MNNHIDHFLKDLKQQHADTAKQKRADLDKKLAAIDKQLAPHMATVQKAQAELDEARACWNAIPVDAEPSDLATWQVIVDKWPERIATLNEPANELREEKRAAESEYSYAINRINAEAKVAVQDAIKDLRVARIVF